MSASVRSVCSHAGRRILVVAACLWLAATASAPSLAVDRLWTTATDGAYGDQTRWSGSQVPGNMDRAIFAVAGTYTVSFATDRISNQLLVGQNVVTLDLNTHTYSLSNLGAEGVVVGGTSNGANLTVVDGTMRAGNAIVGRDANLGGTLNASGTGFIEFLGKLTAGQQSVATIGVNNGGDLKVDGATILAEFAGAAGSQATVDGDGSLWRVGAGAGGGDFTIGQRASATVIVQNGGDLESKKAILGDTATGTGTATVNGPTSSWIATGDLIVGQLGTGTLNIEDGAFVQSTNGAVGGLGTSHGAVFLTGADSKWQVTNAVVIGGAAAGASGEVTIGTGAQLIAAADSGTSAGGILTFAGGTLSAPNFLNLGKTRGAGTLAGNLNNAGTVAPGTSAGLITIEGAYEQGAAGTLDMQIGGFIPGSQVDLLSVQGLAKLAGTLKVSLFNGFNPQLNDEFLLLLANDVDGTFGNHDLPALDPGLMWDVRYSDTDVRLAVVQVPEPSSLALAALGAAGLAFIVRRRSR